jgi:hypothetical protein
LACSDILGRVYRHRYLLIFSLGVYFIAKPVFLSCYWSKNTEMTYKYMILSRWYRPYILPDPDITDH